MRKYGHDYKLIFVGDASMSPYELEQPGGSVEHWNDEAGRVWLERMLRSWPRAAWLNPVAEDHWSLDDVDPERAADHGGADVPRHDRGAGARDEVALVTVIPAKAGIQPERLRALAGPPPPRG